MLSQHLLPYYGNVLYYLISMLSNTLHYFFISYSFSYILIHLFYFLLLDFFIHFLILIFQFSFFIFYSLFFNFPFQNIKRRQTDIDEEMTDEKAELAATAGLLGKCRS